MVRREGVGVSGEEGRGWCERWGRGVVGGVGSCTFSSCHLLAAGFSLHPPHTVLWAHLEVKQCKSSSLLLL